MKSAAFLVLLLMFQMSHAQSTLTVTGAAVLAADGSTANVCADNRVGTVNTHYIFSNNATFCSSTLPVELTSFDLLVVENDHVQVKWSTASEINNDKFNIYRSYDLEKWLVVDVVPGYGTTNLPQQYLIVDGPLYNGTVYYQLEQIDYDGASEMFDIKSVQISNSQKRIDIYPNPAANDFLISGVDSGNYLLHDINGRLIEKANIGFANQQINTATLENGVYFITIHVKDGPAKKLKFLKVDQAK